MLKQEQGILLLALGHPYYGRMAYNLAISIKAVERDAHITLVYTSSAITHINERNMWVFDNKFEFDDNSEPFGAKLLLDKLTPYERTIYIDADTLWINKKGPSTAFTELKGVPFTGITEGFYDYDNPGKSELSKIYPTWADLEEVRTSFSVSGKLYQWRSEFMYFEQSKEVESFFSYAREVYRHAHDLQTVKKFAGHVPDELAINIAANKCGMPPHRYKWQPTYWDRMYGGNMLDIGELQYSYYVISCGSNAGSGALKRVYDRVAAACASRLGLQYVFPLINKKEMMANRQLM